MYTFTGSTLAGYHSNRTTLWYAGAGRGIYVVSLKGARREQLPSIEGGIDNKQEVR